MISAKILSTEQLLVAADFFSGILGQRFPARPVHDCKQGHYKPLLPLPEASEEVASISVAVQ